MAVRRQAFTECRFQARDEGAPHGIPYFTGFEQDGVAQGHVELVSSTSM
jgi:hypothetical protein